MAVFDAQRPPKKKGSAAVWIALARRQGRDMKRFTKDDL